MKKINYFSIFLLSCVLISFQLGTPSFAGEKGYRYWGYFQAPTGVKPWVSAMTGPTTIVPDGSVEGWAFTFSSDSVPDALPPRRLPNFGKLCATFKFNIANQKRVGIVVDFGRAVLRPKNEKEPNLIATCVVIDAQATGYEIMAKIVKIKSDASGLICSLNAYPAKECGAEILTPRSLIPKK